MLHLDYRPRTWEEFAGHEKQVRAVRAMIGRDGYKGGCFWIDGPSGIGKTALAELICGQFAADFDTIHLDGDECSVDAVRDLKRDILVRGWVSPWRAVIVNEAHAMSSKAVQAWLPLLDVWPAQRIVCFTTTQTVKEQPDLFGNFRDPLLSRCRAGLVHLTNYGVKRAFAERAQFVARAAGLDGQDIARYERGVQDCNGNLRELIGKIEAGEMLVA